MHPNFRLLTLEVVALLGAFTVTAAFFSRRSNGAEDAMPAKQALEVELMEHDAVRHLCLPLPIVIGRAVDATLRTQDAQVSRMHARIDQVDGTLLLHDLQSRNGTLLNARPIDAPAPLHAGDEIDAGAVRIRIGKLAPWK
jgi:hypothetical protein